MKRVYASIYEFRDLQILRAETCKKPKAAKLFSTGTYGRIINRRILFTSDIQRFLFRGRFVAFLWSKNGAQRGVYLGFDFALK
jgi:hypothetical protein